MTNQTIRKLPIGIQSFDKLISQNFLYVDKTDLIYNLVHNNVPYFLSRPRRFGKSLLLSAIAAYWEGKRELFKGLAIEKLEEGNADAWQPYPVFYFDFNRDNYQRDTALSEILETYLREWEAAYGCIDPNSSQAIRFQNLLVRAKEKTGRNCVVLVDEYDKPLLEVLENPRLEDYNKAVFKGFFSALKSYDEYLQFVMITGVTKFSKVSIFSDLNQLEDISLDGDYAGICGITEAEIRENFMPEIKRMANEQRISVADCLIRLKQAYDGYRFSSEGVGVYNPYSLLNALKKRKFGSYWFETGTPTFLVRRLKAIDFDARQFSEKSLFATEQMLSDYRANPPNPIPLLYQTGYLTIQDYEERRERYTLGFPNEEVQYGFLGSLMQEYSSESGTGTGKDIFSLDEHIENGNLEGVRDVFIAIFASLPYTSDDSPSENYFQTVIYLIFTLLGKYVHCEVHSYRGRADCIVETRSFIYLFEFKRDKSADETLAQIEKMDYALPYKADKRRLYLIGANFDSKKRMLTEWKAAERTNSDISSS